MLMLCSEDVRFILMGPLTLFAYFKRPQNSLKRKRLYAAVAAQVIEKWKVRHKFSLKPIFSNLSGFEWGEF